MDLFPTTQPDGPWYEIRLQGRLDRRWTAWLNGMTVTPGDGGTTLVRGPVIDQPALHGLLARLRDLGIPLISINQIPAGEAMNPTPPSAPSPQPPGCLLYTSRCV